jgi:hypothetical protein
MKTSLLDQKFTTHNIRYYSVGRTALSMSYPLFLGSPFLSLSTTFHHGSPLSLTHSTWRRVLVFLNANRKIPQAYGITVVAFTWKYLGYRIFHREHVTP